MLSGLNENFDNVFSIVIENMLTKKDVINDVKALLLSHENHLEGKKIVNLCSLFSITISVKVDSSSVQDSQSLVPETHQLMNQLGIDRHIFFGKNQGYSFGNNYQIYQ